MKKELKKAEDKIKEYFADKTKIEVLKNTTDTLEEKKLRISKKINDLNIDFDISIKSPSFESISKGSISKGSYFENNISNQISNYEKMINNIDEEIERANSEIARLEIINSKMDNTLNVLNEDYKKILVLKYYKKENILSICEKLHFSEALFHKKKNIALRNIYNMLIMFGGN